MISERNGNVKVQDNLQGTKIAMDIAAGAKAHIMAILTNLYSDRKMAVLREYSTNGYDSHVMAGTPDRPIEITLPDFHAPLGSRSLKIRDYGIGLSVEDIHSIYSQYGESTKNDSNQYNGMLGLGSKSGLTYTNSFVVTAIKHGTRCSVAVGLDDDGLPQMTVMETAATTDHPGVEVVIPVKSGDDFHQVAARLFRFWHAGTVLINGAQPQDFRTNALHVCAEDGYTIWVDEDGDRDYVVMGNVAYPATFEHKMSKGSLIVEVPIGDVNFTPSREALMDTARTRATLDKAHALFFKHIQAAAQKDIDAADSPAEAIERMYRWETTMARGAAGGYYYYRGALIPRKYEHADVTVNDEEVPGMVVVPYNKHKLAHHTRMRGIGSEKYQKAIWFTGFNLASFNANHRKKIDFWFSQQPDTYRANFTGGNSYYYGPMYLLVSDEPPRAWVKPERIVPWDTIAAIRLQPQTTPIGGSIGRVTGSYDVLVDGTRKRGVPASQFDLTKPLLYIHGSAGNAVWYRDALNHFYPKGYTLVYMGMNRVAKFERDFPAATKVAAALEAKCAVWLKSIPSDDKIALRLDSSYYGDGAELKAIDPTRVKDPELAVAARIAKRDLTGLEAARKMANKILGRSVVDAALGTFKNPLKKYPLFDTDVLRENPKHVYHYLNTAYAATI